MVSFSKTILSKIFYIIALLLSCISCRIHAQHIFLEHHTFTDSSQRIGKLSVKEAGDIKFSLCGKNARRFKISTDNTLYIKKRFSHISLPVDVCIIARTENILFKDTLRIVKDQFIRNKVVAHRGAWKNTGETENSLGALKKAIELGCEYSELDVNLSSDGILFVNHDATIQGFKIDTTHSSVLKSIILPNGETLPTLEEYVQEVMKQTNTRLLIEVKPFSVTRKRALEAAEKTAELITKMRAQAWVSYISFNYDILKKIRETQPNARLSYLNGDKKPEEVAADGFWGIDYYYEVYKKNPEWIKQALEKALDVNVWVVDKEQDMDWFLEKGVNSITTDEPELLLKKIENRKP